MLLVTQVADGIRQTVVDLAAIAPCHRSAKRAHYLIGVLARRLNVVITSSMSLYVEIGTVATENEVSSVEEKILEMELSGKWQSSSGRFVGMSHRLTVALKDLQSPPFWLIYEQSRIVSPSLAVLAETGFCLLP